MIINYRFTCLKAEFGYKKLTKLQDFKRFQEAEASIPEFEN
jgi:hypothetical protein